MSGIGDYFRDAFDALADVAGTTVEYARGDNWISACAVTGQTTFQSADPSGVIVEFQTRDFIFPSCDLFFGDDTQIVPKRGDTITEEQDGRMFIYEVRRPDGDDQVW